MGKIRFGVFVFFGGLIIGLGGVVLIRKIIYLYSKKRRKKKFKRMMADLQLEDKEKDSR